MNDEGDEVLESKQDLRNRTKNLALRVIRLYSALPKTTLLNIKLIIHHSSFVEGLCNLAQTGVLVVATVS